MLTQHVWTSLPFQGWSLDQPTRDPPELRVWSQHVWTSFPIHGWSMDHPFKSDILVYVRLKHRISRTSWVILWHLKATLDNPLSDTQHECSQWCHINVCEGTHFSSFDILSLTVLLISEYNPCVSPPLILPCLLYGKVGLQFQPHVVTQKKTGVS